MTFRFRGFTLIELLIAVAIFIFLIMLAGPSLSDFLASSQVRNRAEAMLNGVQQAQATAIRDNTPTRLQLNLATGWQVIQTVEGADSTVQVYSIADGSPKAQIARTPGDATQITFDGFGRAQCNADGTANLQRIDVSHITNSSARALRVCITGQQVAGCPGSVPIASSQIKLCDPAAASTEPQACPASC